MEEIYLRKPTLDDKDQASSYIQEFYDNNIEIHGTGGLDRYLKESTYEEWLEKLEKDLNGPYESGLVPASTFFGVRVSDNKIVGMVNIRHELNDSLLEYGGHIGYAIRPSEHGKHYGTRMCKLTLDYCKKDLNLTRVLITCDKENPASAHVILNNGGVLENETVLEKGFVHQRYWIDMTK